MAEDFDWNELKQYGDLFDLWLNARCAKRKLRSSKSLKLLHKLAKVFCLSGVTSLVISFVLAVELFALCEPTIIVLVLYSAVSIPLGMYYVEMVSIRESREWIERSGHMVYEESNKQPLEEE